MQQILTVWSSLEPRRRVIVAGATLVMFAAIIGLSRMASQPSLSLLYSGLEPSAAGDVVASLEQQGVAFEVRAGTIFVDGALRDSLRMTLAAEGLPANGSMGYELLDSLSGFGTTSQMFDAAYWRAKEGELARTITASPSVRTARVHISNPSSNPFQRDLKPTASVSITGASGAIGPAQAKAFKYLVASAVAGLNAEDVSIIDGNGALVTAEDDMSMTGNDRASDLRRNIQRILEARVGPGKAVVEVNVETETDREAIVERRFDPDSRVAISTDTEERSSTSSGSDNGAVTVASNLPDGDATGGESSSQSENTETRERVNYEVSETTRELVRGPGAIKRVSVAVLVDGLRAADPATGAETWTARSDAELEALRELVASAIGFNADRGDSITIKSMEFEPLEIDDGTDPVSLLSGLHFDAMALIQMAVLALVALAMGLFVVRPILAKPAAVPALAGPDRAGGRQPAGQAGAQAGQDGGGAAGLPQPANALNGEIDDGLEPLPGLAMIGQNGDLPDLMQNAGFQYEEDPVDRLRQLIQDRREETVEILRSWMEEEHGEDA